MSRNLLALIAFVFASVGLAPAATAAQQPTRIDVILAQQLAAEPGGTVVGNTIEYDDGTVFVAVDVGTQSLSQCTTGFCLWGQTNYLGSFRYKTGSGVTRSISGTVGSVWNNRAKAARLYNNTGSAWTCYAAGSGVQQSGVRRT